MNLDSDKIEAFAMLSKHLNYSKASEELHISQPALSKKIVKLEDELGTSLFIRSKRKVELTEAGIELVSYWQSKNELDRELLNRIGNANQEISGTVRIAGFSTITSSVILPSIKPLMSKNSQLRLEMYSKEVSELPSLLINGQVDFILTKEPLEKENIISENIGNETLIHVAPHGKKDELPFLDHDPKDTETFDFLKAQGIKSPIKRYFVDDVHSILSGVECGLGQAIIGLHLFKKESMVKIPHRKLIETPVFLCYKKRLFIPQLHKDIIHTLKTNLPSKLF